MKEHSTGQDSGVSSTQLPESQLVREALFAVYVITQGCLQAKAATSVSAATQLLVYQVYSK